VGRSSGRDPSRPSAYGSPHKSTLSYTPIPYPTPLLYTPTHTYPHIHYTTPSHTQRVWEIRPPARYQRMGRGAGTAETPGRPLRSEDRAASPIPESEGGNDAGSLFGPGTHREDRASLTIPTDRTGLQGQPPSSPGEIAPPARYHSTGARSAHGPRAHYPHTELHEHGYQPPPLLLR
jgi:hypothetical protein